MNRFSRKFVPAGLALGIGFLFIFAYEANAQNVRPKRIISPQGSVSCSDSVWVIAVVEQVTGTNPDTIFPVECIIDTTPIGGSFIYVDTAFAYTAGNNDTDVVYFKPWPVPNPPPDTYSIRVVTLLSGDSDITNDTLINTVSIMCPGDVGVISIDAPPVVIDSGVPVQVRATVKNFGNVFVDSFRVFLSVAGFTNNVLVSNLDTNSTDQVSFAFWPVQVACNTTHTLKVWTVLSSDIHFHNDTLAQNIFVRCIVHDVGVVSIDAPPAVIDSGIPVQVRATVKNFGNVLEDSFRVFLSVAGFTNNVLVSNLDTDSTDQVSFAFWPVQVACNTSQLLKVWTELNSDLNQDNDTLTQNIFVRCQRHDVGVVSILSPPDTVPCSDSVSVSATVCNLGTETDTFAVRAIIRSTSGIVYGDTVSSIILSSDSCYIVTFGEKWVLHSADSQYTVSIRTLLSGDDDTSNDSLVDTVNSVCDHDVGVLSINAPSEIVLGDSTQVTAIVKNSGNAFEDSFDVSLFIAGFSNTQIVTNLAPGALDTVTFPYWTPVTTCDSSYTLSVWTLLSGDNDPGNDTLSQNIFLHCIDHDVGVISVDAPDPVEVAGTTVSVQATVMNFGETTETFYMRYTVPGFADSQQVVGLMPDSSRPVPLPSWAIPLSPCNQPDTLIVTAVLSSDIHPNDNTRSHNVYVKCPGTKVRDVGVVSIVEPPPNVPADTTVSVMATVKNYGDTTETFYVRYTVAGDRDSQQVVDLQPDSSLQVTFASWAVPLSPCDTSYTLIVKTLLPLDFISSDDSIAYNVFVECPSVIHDVAVDSILVPQATVPAGSTIFPQVRVRNLSPIQETFVLSLSVGDYTRDTTITVDSNLTQIVTFDSSWTVDTLCPLSYNATATVYLNLDNNSGNNSKNQDVLVECGLLPLPFSLISPDGAFFNRDSVPFVWHSTISPDFSTIRYYLIVSADTLFDTTAITTIDTTITDTTMSLTFGLDNSVHYWRVEATSTLNPSFIRFSQEVFNFSIVTKPDLVPLFLNFPNPVEGSGTTIKYSLSKPASVTVSLYDVSGQMMKQLEKDESKPQGVYFVSWDGRDHRGKELANGVYLCEIKAKATTGGDEERKFRRIAVYRE